MAVGAEGAPPVQGTLARPVTVGWFLKRSLLAVVILIVAMGGLAWLTYASIDPNTDIDAPPTAAKAAPDSAPRVTPVEL
ncbi:MAG: hypothetical protein AB7S70_06695 [Hyphomicrobium sp.]|uniref:hypothetical protein n=1 Tax=Hyphomicrobium sp. TaxID=82 RepID=UPI003D0E23C2